MAAEVSFVKNRKDQGFVNLLSSAACEWLLIFLLFVEAVFSYLLPKFANYCELQTPCPFCSRLDHVLGKKKPGFCWTLLCRNHKEEVSSLVSCTIHGNLADIEGMCKECLTSTTMQRTSNPEGCKLLVGKLWVDVDRSTVQNLMLNKYKKHGSSGLRACSCCNKTWKAKSSAERLLELEQAGLGASKANLKPPLPRMPGHSRFSRRENLKRLRDKFPGSTGHQATGKNTVDKLSHVGYTKIKFNSGSESEVPFSEDEDDDDDDGTVSGGSNFSKSEYGVKVGRRGIPRPPVKNVASDKQACQDLKDQPNKPDLNKQKNVKPPSSDAEQDNGSRKLEAESYHTPRPSLTTDQISLDDVSQTPDPGLSGASEEASKFSVPRNAALSTLTELYSLFKVPCSSITVTSSKSINVGGPSEKVDTSVTIHVQAGAGSSSDSTRASELNIQNQTNSCEHAVEPINASDSSKTQEEKKSPSKDSTSEDGSLYLKDTTSKPTNKQSGPRKDDDSSFPARLQASTSDVGSLNAREAICKPQHAQNESRKGGEAQGKQNESSKGEETQYEQNESSKGEETHDEQNEPRKGRQTHDDQNESIKDEDSRSQAQPQISTSEVGDFFRKETGRKPDDEQNKSRKGEDSSSLAVPQVSTPEAGGVLPKDTRPRTYDEHKESVTTEAGGTFPKETGPRPQDKRVESIKDEGSSYLAMPGSPSKRNESTHETVSEIEGESTIDRLKQQVEHDRSIINSLYKELEEERNASSVAANEAMVMITKLQEEKAALHTEALQYLRMMEEQAEYDMDALKRANDLLAERDKELQDLEDELEFYRNNFEESGTDLKETSVLENDVADNSENSPDTSDSKSANISAVPRNTSPSEFKNEKLHVMDFLKKLEEELRQAYCDGELDNMPDRLYSDEIQNEVGSLNDSSLDVETSSHPQTEDGISIVPKKENAVLHDRLEALETDRDFLKHASDLLWNGKDGLQLIQEVAYQLKELRKMEFKRR